MAKSPLPAKLAAYLAQQASKDVQKNVPRTSATPRSDSVPSIAARPRQATSPATPRHTFASAPGTKVGIALSYTVTGMEVRSITEPAGPAAGPQRLSEAFEIDGWMQSAPSDIQ